MALVKTDAIVLKSFPYGDSSKIARCYTRGYGKISVIGKGVRKGKDLRSGYLEPLSYLTLIFYYSPKRRLQTFSKAEFINVWRSVKSDVKKISYGFAVVELVDRSVAGEEPHEDLFWLLANTLQTINDTRGNINFIFWYYEIQLLSLLGFRPILSECPRCCGELKRGYFSMEYGELLCSRCFKGNAHLPPNSAGQSVEVSPHALNILKRLKHGRLNNIATISLKRGDRQQIGSFLHHYLGYHIEGMREVKSLTVMEKMLS